MHMIVCKFMVHFTDLRVFGEAYVQYVGDFEVCVNKFSLFLYVSDP